MQMPDPQQRVPEVPAAGVATEVDGLPDVTSLAEVPSPVEVRVHADPALIPSVRAVAADLAARADFDLDAVSDLRMAVALQPAGVAFMEIMVGARSDDAVRERFAEFRQQLGPRFAQRTAEWAKAAGVKLPEPGKPAAPVKEVSPPPALEPIEEKPKSAGGFWSFFSRR